jgi:hypothetical protein
MSEGGFDPRRWKREHRGAFFIAIMLGAVAGIYWQFSRESWGYSDWQHEVFLAHLLGRAVFVAFAAGAFVYVRQLLR